MNTPRLETHRLILRKFTEGDIGALYEILRDREVNTFLPWFPTERMEDAAAFFRERFAASYQKPQAYSYAVCLRRDDMSPSRWMTAMRWAMGCGRNSGTRGSQQRRFGLWRSRRGGTISPISPPPTT